MASGKSVFIIGPGFIGWNVIDLLVAEGYSVTGFVRRKEHADGIKASGASQVIMGDLNDKEKIMDQSTQHDIIVSTLRYERYTVSRADGTDTHCYR